MSEERASKRRGRISGAVAVADVAEAIKDLASTFSASSGAQTTPERRVKAIRAAEKDKDMTATQKISLISLFQSDISYADAYMAFEDMELRTAYIKTII